METVTSLIIVCSLLAFVASAVKRVPSGQVVSVYRRGKSRLLQEGTHLTFPLLDRIGHRIDLSGQTLRFEADEVSGTVYWQVLEPERADPVIDQAEQLIRGNTVEALSTVPVETEQSRRELATQVKQMMNRSLRERGMMVTRVELDVA